MGNTHPNVVDPTGRVTNDWYFNEAGQVRRFDSPPDADFGWTWLDPNDYVFAGGTFDEVIISANRTVPAPLPKPVVITTPEVIPLKGNSAYDGELVVKTAIKYERKFKYTYGARGSKGLIDCSGFIQKVLKETFPEVAKRVGASSSEMVTNADKFGGLRKTNLKVGDLIFWGGHVEFISAVNGKSFSTIGANGSDATKGLTPNSKTFSGFNDPKLKWYGNGKVKGVFTPR